MSLVQRILRSFNLAAGANAVAVEIGRKDGIRRKLVRSQPIRAKMALDERNSAIDNALSPTRPDRLKLYALYRSTVDDDQVFTVVQTRTLKVLEQPFVFIVQKRAVGSRFSDEHRQLFGQWFHDFLRYAIESIYWGHSLIEFGDADTNAGTPGEVLLIPRDHVRPELGDVLLQLHGQESVSYRDGKGSEWLFEIGRPYELGLLKIVSRPVIFKNFSLVDWAQYSEKFAQPVIAIRTETRDEKELDKLEASAKSFGRNSWIVLPKEDDLNFVESFKTSGHLPYRDMLEVMDEAISKIVLGQTMTTDSGSSLSQAVVHERVMDSYVAADMRMLEALVNDRLLPFLERQYSMPLSGVRFAWYQFTDEYRQEAAAAAQQAAGGAAAKKP